MAPPLFARPCVVVLVIAVAISRLMSTNGRAVRLQTQQQQQQRHHSTGLEDGIGGSYSDPELDIDRLYDLMKDRAANRIQQQQQPLRPGLTQPPASAAQVAASAAAAVGSAPSPHQPAAQHQQLPVNDTKAAVYAAQPRYHFEVHSVQHTGQPFQTAEQKLRTVVRQAAAVEYHLKDAGDGRQTLLDDNDIHRKWLARAKAAAAAAEKSAPKPDDGRAIAAAAASIAEARQRIEQEELRQLMEQEQRYYNEGELDDEEMQEPYIPVAEPEMAAEAAPSKQEVSEINRILKQQMVAAAAEDEGGRRPPAVAQQREPDVGTSALRDVGEVSAPLALPVKKALSDTLDRSSMHETAGSASSIADIYFLAVVVGCAVAGVAGFMFAGLCWYRLHRKMKEAGDVDYPAYGVTGPVQSSTGPSGTIGSMPGGTAGSPGDRKLAQSAQMYHYQHQKQQMIASERLSSDVNHHAVGAGTGSDAESEEENEDGDYTVFECPGLATNGEMEVRNPMFNDPTPVGTPADASGLYGQAKK